MNIRRFNHNLLLGGAQVCYAPPNDSGGGGDNQGGGSGGNTSQQTQDSGTQNNNGQSFDLNAFWERPPSGSDGSPSSSSQGGSADSNGSGGGAQSSQSNQSQGTTQAQEFMNRLNNLTFGEVFNQEVINGLAEGKVEGVNKAISDVGRESVRQSVLAAAQLMQGFGQQLQMQFQEMIREALGGRDNSHALEKEFPQLATNPSLRPMIEGVFKQSMLHTKNDRSKAIEMTRSMLQHFGQGLSKDNLFTPPQDSSDNMAANSTSLVEELLGRR